MAWGGRMTESSWRVYCVLGDGEIQEGQVWEAAMLAGKHRLSNLTAILDQNQVQQSDKVVDILDIDPVAPKWRAFGWHVREIDGHDLAQVLDALDEAEVVADRPTLIVAHTIKGKGVSWMELNPKWHGEAPSEEQAEIAIAEIEGRIDAEESRRRLEALEGGS
jgi:transketolase